MIWSSAAYAKSCRRKHEKRRRAQRFKLGACLVATHINGIAKKVDNEKRTLKPLKCQRFRKFFPGAHKVLVTRPENIIK